MATDLTTVFCVERDRKRAETNGGDRKREAIKMKQASKSYQFYRDQYRQRLQELRTFLGACAWDHEGLTVDVRDRDKDTVIVLKKGQRVLALNVLQVLGALRLVAARQSMDDITARQDKTKEVFDNGKSNV
ncbi:MAG: hypothetical protein A4E63_01271 [Syntrophorhabdus sp. PtaU1.Bin050]|nr:MAG: hypothetical protein A4E63_01271 [Syntrophorhabdus sp. PtaU1.Bin050]